MFVIGRGRYAKAVYPQAPRVTPDDHKVAVTAVDPTPDFLAAKVTAGPGISLAVLPGQQLEITATAVSEDHKVQVTAADTTPGFLDAKIAAGTNVVKTVLFPAGNEQVELSVPSAAPSGAAGGDLAGTYPNPSVVALTEAGGPTSLPISAIANGQLFIRIGGIVVGISPSGLYPVPDNVFSVNDNVDPTKFLNIELAGQAAGTTQTIVTTATISRPFRLPDISGTAVVMQDVTGQVFIGIGVTGTLHGSNAGIQYSSTTANRGAVRVNQYGANVGVPGFVGFKSRGATIGSTASVIAGDVLWRGTAIGVTGDNVSVPNAAFISIVVAAGGPTAAQCPCQYELELTNLAGARQLAFKVTTEGEAQTLRGVRAGGPATLPAALGAGTLWSSGTGSPETVITGSPGDLWSRTDGGSSTTLYVKESGVATNTGWIPVQSAGVARNVLFWGAGTLALTAVTRFLRPGYQSGLAPTTSVRMPITRAGTLQRLFVRCRVAGAGVNNITYTVLLNGVATTLAVSMLPTAVSASNIANTVAVVAGDFVELQVTKAGVIVTTPTDVEVAFEEAA